MASQTPTDTIAFLDAVRTKIGTVVVGQDVVVERLLVALLTSGHLLLEGVPGLAKTLLVSCLAKAIDLHFARIQFTIDLLPSDILGSEILDPRVNEFKVSKGPIFTNLLLADEINRAAPKVQSALLEAMQERKVTIGKESFRLPAPFLVIATQNPVEQAGTFELPEAQLDRFMLRHRLTYPTPAEERDILHRNLALGVKRDGGGGGGPHRVRRAGRVAGRRHRATGGGDGGRQPGACVGHVRGPCGGGGEPHPAPPGRRTGGQPAGPASRW